MSHRVVKLRGVADRIKANQKQMAKVWQGMIEEGTDPSDEEAQAELRTQYILNNADVLAEEITYKSRRSKRRR